MLGNDLVDLLDPETRDAARRERFASRICAPEELERWEAATALPSCNKLPAGHLLLWSLWAAKEAAFKAVSRAQPQIIFSPRRFILAGDLRSLRYGELQLQLTIESAPEGWLHALAWTGTSPVQRGIHRCVAAASGEARQHLIAAVRSTLPPEHAKGRLSVERAEDPGAWTGRAPPRLHLDGVPLPYTCSLSHHGRFLAWAFRQD